MDWSKHFPLVLWLRARDQRKRPQALDSGDSFLKVVQISEIQSLAI